MAVLQPMATEINISRCSGNVAERKSGRNVKGALNVTKIFQSKGLRGGIVGETNVRR